MPRFLLCLGLLIAGTVCPGRAIAEDAAPAAAAAPAAGPAIDPAVAEELKYADGLNALGFSWYADQVIAAIKGNDGGRKVVSEIKSKVGIKKFAEANALIAKQPDQDGQAVWAMKLTVADGYYGWGMYSNAQEIYQSFFKKFPDGPPEALNTFYTTSGYKYAQMMLLTGQDAAALEAFRATLKAKSMDRSFKRQIQTEMAELMVKIGSKMTGEDQKKLFEEIKKICDEILWVQDVWFGKAIVMLAHIKMLSGDIEGSQKLMDDYRDQLKAIDDMLRQDAEEAGDDLMKISPMANCHYMLGVIMQNEAEKLIAANGDKETILALLAGKVTGKTKEGKDKRSFGALQHLMTVFASYPSTSWAPDAGVRGQKVQETLKNMGVEINIKISDEKKKEIEALQFREARALFNQQKWSDAAEAYGQVLKLFPEGETALGALSELAMCYIELGEDLFADTVVHHVAQRFGGTSPFMAMAGDQLLRTAQLYTDRKLNEKKEDAYKLYFENFPKHSRMPAILFSFGLQKLAAEDYTGAMDYFKKIQTTYTNSTPYFDSINRIATCYEKLGDVTNEVRVLEDYIQQLEKAGTSVDAIRGKYRLAIALRKMGPKSMGAALNRFGELDKQLSDPKHPYQRTPEEKETSDRILEGSKFFKALCYASLTQPEDKLASYKQSALDGFSSLVAKFPKSPYAPSALAQVGTIWMILKDPEKAQVALARLQKDYPDSAEAKNVDYMLADSLLKLGRPKEAKEAFKKMFDQSGGKYTEIQILTAGDELFKSKEYEIAHQAFSKVLETTKDPKIKELALVKDGSALVEMGNAEEAIKALETLFKLYPKSAYTIDGSFYLSRTCSELGAKEADETKREEYFTKAIKAMSKASIYEKATPGLLRIDLAVARMWLMRAKAENQFRGKKEADYKEKAIGAYQSIVLLNNPEKPELRLMIEDAYNESIPLFVEGEKWDDVLENCDKYLVTFSSGRYLSDVRRWRNKARMNTQGTGPKAEEDEEPSSPTPPEPDEDEPKEAAPAPAAATAPAKPDGEPAVQPAGTNKPPATARPATNKPPATVQGARPAGTNKPPAKVAGAAVQPASTNKPPVTVRPSTNKPPAKVQGTKPADTNKPPAAATQPAAPKEPAESKDVTEAE